MSREKQIIEIKECIDSVYGADCAYFDVDGFAIANKIYDAGYRKQEWISVDERLPDKEGKYLVCTTNGNIGVGDFIDYYGKGTHLCFACWAVTHWMPLPEAPKMKGGAE